MTRREACLKYSPRRRISCCRWLATGTLPEVNEGIGGEHRVDCRGCRVAFSREGDSARRGMVGFDGCDVVTAGLAVVVPVDLAAESVCHERRR